MKISKSLVIIISLLPLFLFASTKDEINHLLKYVAETDCQYERNGSIYNGKKALEHIKKKYDYFYDDIKTAEDFILYAATKSKMSGKYYKIHCPGHSPVRSQEWLLTELKKYRSLNQIHKNDK